MHLLGSQMAELSGREQTPTRTNYYLGNDSRNWHLAVPSYRSIAYAGIYQGIDLIYHGEGSQLEYDFVISPGSDPTQIRMSFDGLKPLLQGKDLSFEGQNQISVGALKAFQMLDGKKKTVDADWDIRGDRASIHLGPYDHGHDLIIDPIFFYGTYIGGNGVDDAVSVVPGARRISITWHFLPAQQNLRNLRRTQAFPIPTAAVARAGPIHLSSRSRRQPIFLFGERTHLKPQIPRRPLSSTLQSCLQPT